MRPKYPFHTTGIGEHFDVHIHETFEDFVTKRQSPTYTAHNHLLSVIRNHRRRHGPETRWRLSEPAPGHFRITRIS